MNNKSYRLARTFITESAADFIEEGTREFGSKELQGGWFIIRVQALPASSMQDLIGSIPGTVPGKMGTAYDPGNLYFFPLFEEMDIVSRVLRELDYMLIESIGIGWLERIDGKCMICNFTMIGDNKRGITGSVSINCLELKWLSEPVFTVEGIVDCG